MFLATAGGDREAAYAVAESLLAGYNAHTEEEPRLAGDIVAFGFGALDALSRSMAPGLTNNAIPRLSGNANTQQRSPKATPTTKRVNRRTIFAS